jgi:plasmid stabilization system protein ParE
VPTRIVWSEAANAALIEIYEFVAPHSPRYAEVLVRRLIAAPERLAEFPESGHIVPELEREDVREVLWRDYRIVYQLHGPHVAILTVFRASRLLPPLHLAEDEGKSSATRTR